jgi:predicted transcriptional regulator
MSDTIKALEEKAQRLINALERVGVRLSVATVIVHLKDIGEATSGDLEMRSGLMPQDVIIALHHLREKNWIEERETEADEKGAPVHLYRLTASIEDIVKHHKDTEYFDWMAFWDYVEGL